MHHRDSENREIAQREKIFFFARAKKKVLGREARHNGLKAETPDPRFEHRHIKIQ